MGRLARTAGPALLFLFGLAVSLYYGRRGFMPLDQSVVFDGGWRILSGQVPFRDYVAPNGFAVHGLQALFFAAGGTTWFWYCLHAAVVNGLFAILVDRILRVLGMAVGPSFVYAALSALVLYPPIGVPFMDAHAFFFSALGVWMALHGRTAETQHPLTWPWLLLPLVMALAALSKQIPSAFVLPIVLAIALTGPAAPWVRRLLLMLAGTTGLLASLATLAFALEIDPGLVNTYFFRLPAEEATRRLGNLPLATAPSALWDGVRTLGLWSIAAVQGAFLFASFVVRSSTRPLRTMLLAQALLLVGLVFAVVTLNQEEMAVAYLFLAAGLAHLSLTQARAQLASHPRLRIAARAAAALVLVVAIRDGVSFARQVDATRIVNDIRWDPSIAERNAPELHPDLAFMGWQVPAVVPYDARDLTQLAVFLAAKPRGFLLIGDATVLYGLTGKESPAPALWLHPGLTVPLPGTKAMTDYENWLLERIASLDVRYLVLEGRHTWNHVTVEHFPRIEAMVRSNRIVARFGAFRVVDLAAGDRSVRP